MTGWSRENSIDIDLEDDDAMVEPIGDGAGNVENDVDLDCIDGDHDKGQVDVLKPKSMLPKGGGGEELRLKLKKWKDSVDTDSPVFSQNGQQAFAYIMVLIALTLWSATINY